MSQAHQFGTIVMTQVIWDKPGSSAVESQLCYGWKIVEVSTRKTKLAGEDTVTVLSRVSIFKNEQGFVHLIEVGV